jgi:putative addiction module component (TIGR02574 family)
MTTIAKQLLEQAMALDEDDRVELIGRLSDSLEPSADPDYIEAWGAEIKSRLDDIDSGRAKMIPADEVIRKLRAEVNRDAKTG